MKLDFLYRGTPGHPLHPPLSDATIGTYTFATVVAVLSKLGLVEQEAAQAWTLALIVGLIFSGLTALTGFADWVRIERGTPLFRTATAHMIAMLIATAFFLISIGAGYSDGIDGAIPDGAFILTLVGFVMLTVGGWLGGAIVFNYGMRVLNLVQEPAHRAVSPIPHREEEAADK
ncbi:MAG: DUF2231 domain-containing protein [Actinomycetota bacterium]|nr:DUF2231 domain-containing protein [Actinomycetota bacterium]